MKIPFNHFERHFEKIETEIDVAVSKVLKSGWYILGKEVESFENNFASYTGSKYCVSVANGTEAIALALMALDIGRGDEVITTSLTAYPTITAIEMTGAMPVVADVKENCLLDPAAVEFMITDKTKAIIPVHLFGQICDMEKFCLISNKYSIPLIEDCAQSTGARRNNIHCGNFGVLGCFSFYPTKNLGAFGDAGAVTTNDISLAEKLRSLRNYGQTDRYKHDSSGINSRMDEIQAAILNVKLQYIESWNESRQIISQFYSRKLPINIQLKRFSEGDVFHLFPVLVEDRNEFMDSMKELGVGTIIHYPYPVYAQKAYKGRFGIYENTERLCSQLVSLPLNPELTDDEVTYIVKAVKFSLK